DDVAARSVTSRYRVQLRMYYLLLFFFFNDTATTEIYTLSLHDALPIWRKSGWRGGRTWWTRWARWRCRSGYRGPSRRRAWRQHDHARVVSPAASAAHPHLEHAQQHELHGDRRACRPGTDCEYSQNRAGEFL